MQNRITKLIETNFSEHMSFGFKSSCHFIFIYNKLMLILDNDQRRNPTSTMYYFFRKLHEKVLDMFLISHVIILLF